MHKSLKLDEKAVRNILTPTLSYFYFVLLVSWTLDLVDEPLHNKDSSSWLKNKFHAYSDECNIQNTYSR